MGRELTDEEKLERAIRKRTKKWDAADEKLKGTMIVVVHCNAITEEKRRSGWYEREEREEIARAKKRLAELPRRYVQYLYRNGQQPKAPSEKWAVNLPVSLGLKLGHISNQTCPFSPVSALLITPN
jgi:hypothetical protein